MFWRATMCRTMVVLGLLSLGLAGRPAAAEPVLGGSLFATGGSLKVTVQPSSTDYTEDLYLIDPAGGADIFIASGSAAGTVVPLPTYAAGTPLVFYILVQNTGERFYMGDGVTPGSQNPDGIPHAAVDVTGPGTATVGFEDLFGGGDEDYNDTRFAFEGVVPTPGDTTPPVIGDCSVSKNSLWPPNHKMVDITLNYTVSDNVTPVDELKTEIIITSNEPDNGLGDGDTANDFEVIDAHHIRLRAERSGKGSGRVYTVTIIVTDSSGNSTTETCLVTVPHDQGKK